MRTVCFHLYHTVCPSLIKMLTDREVNKQKKREYSPILSLSLIWYGPTVNCILVPWLLILPWSFCESVFVQSHFREVFLTQSKNWIRFENCVSKQKIFICLKQRDLKETVYWYSPLVIQQDIWYLLHELKNCQTTKFCVLQVTLFLFHWLINKNVKISLTLSSVVSELGTEIPIYVLFLNYSFDIRDAQYSCHCISRWKLKKLCCFARFENFSSYLRLVSQP